jgi:hypothetical protein
VIVAAPVVDIFQHQCSLIAFRVEIALILREGIREPLAMPFSFAPPEFPTSLTASSLYSIFGVWWTPVCVFGRKFVTTPTMCLRRPHTTSLIFNVRYWLKMIRANTARVTAKMIQEQPGRNTTLEIFIDDPMSHKSLSCWKFPDQSVA